MSARLQFTVTGVSGPVRHFHLTEPQTCIIGRAPSCVVALPATREYSDVSRRHCALKVDPPFVHVRDLGSLNGTYVNGINIGGRMSRNLRDTMEDAPEWIPLHDGDELRLGQRVALRVEIHEFADEECQTSEKSVGSGTFLVFPD
jgi:pSer/pThr/pTyr-binding forkhead associated (FHA) protein